MIFIQIWGIHPLINNKVYYMINDIGEKERNEKTNQII